MRPRARHNQLRIQSVAGETLVYDDRTDKVYVLNPTATAVWTACDGQRTIPELVRYLNQQTPTDEQTVWYALGQLNDLLEQPVQAPRNQVNLSRRQFLKRSGLVAAAVSVPVVVMLVAPRPAAAQSTEIYCCICVDNFVPTVTGCIECEVICNSSHGGVDFCDPGICPPS